MKKKDYILFLATAFATLFSFAPDLSAQNNQKFVVKPRQFPVRAIPFTEQYLFSSFKQSIVCFYNAQMVGALLSYNLLFGEIQFIHSQGDTLSFA